jgi:hypothetical protein
LIVYLFLDKKIDTFQISFRDFDLKVLKIKKELIVTPDKDKWIKYNFMKFYNSMKKINILDLDFKCLLLLECLDSQKFSLQAEAKNNGKMKF